ncbi:MAG: hypothetical protein IJE84_04520 [Clostridia bacterium]|nr:hypothetical protein [Clostridia bacterium]
MNAGENILSVILAAASAIVLISNAAEKIARALRAAKTPIDTYNDRLTALELWKEEADRKLSRDNDRLSSIDESSRVTQRAILALLDHGIDGNNVDGLCSAKEELQNHLINR